MRQYKKSIAIIVAMIVPFFMFMPQFIFSQKSMDLNLNSSKEQVYTSRPLGFSVRYPGNYKALSNMQNGFVDEYSVVFIENSLENQAMLRSVQEGGKGPTSISVRIIANADGSDLNTWVLNYPKSNYQAGGKNMTSVSLAGLPAVAYSWTGEHNGHSVAVIRGNLIYVFSVTYETPFDKIIGDFNAFLKTVGFLDIK